ncbi:MAG: EAL domain-containing protein [Gammaproteobacteria bacterium]|nr:EAL domain-containing protein [Gammaproteobacteria bacterium]
MKQFKPKKANSSLEWRFALIGLIAIVVTAAVLSIYHRQLTVEHFIGTEQRSHIALSQTIVNTLIPKYSDFLKQAESTPKSVLVANPLSRQLHNDLQDIAKALPVLKIEIFDTSAKTLFSTDTAQTGTVQSPGYSGSRVSRSGDVVSSISARDRLLNLDGTEVYNRSVLSSYLPLYAENDNNIIAVLSIDSDITVGLAEIEDEQLKLGILALSMLSVLYLALYFSVGTMARKLTRQNAAYKKVDEFSSQLASLLDKSCNEVFVFDAASLKLTHYNQRASDNLGFCAKELDQVTMAQLIPVVSSEEFPSLVEPLLSGDIEQLEFDTVYQRKDGTQYPVEVLLQYSGAERQPVFLAVALDVTEKKKAEDRLNFLAYHDSLTGLPNRRLLVDRVEQAIEAAVVDEQLGAILFIDLDKFKDINDSLGHEAGDSLLTDTAERLVGCMRAADTVARWGGDEFCLLLKDVGSVNNVFTVVEKIKASLSEAFLLMGERIFISASIGIILYPLEDTDAGDLLRNAGTAMYQAKDKGISNYRFYCHEMGKQIEQRLDLVLEMRYALERKEFTLYYQPKVEVKSGKVVGVEALIRWQHPERGLVPPDQFISVAEETGFIIPVGKWVLQQACEQMKALREYGLESIPVSVNLSIGQLQKASLVDDVRQILRQTEFEPSMLDLEITESMLMSDIDHVTQTLRELAELGVTISVDDFGTGYSSLAYLKQFPISTLKIDRSFIRDIPDDKDDMSITIAIINMAKGLGLKTVAEGVEIREQLEFLKTHECDLIQGYFFSKPVAFGEIVIMLQREQGVGNQVQADLAVL